MSDAAAAPAAQPSAPAPSLPSGPQQVPVDTSPVHIPNPVGSQTPTPSRGLPSVRDSLSKAFESASKPVNTDRPKPEQRRQEQQRRQPERRQEARQEARERPPPMGHNNPPGEPMQLDRRQQREQRRMDREQQPFDLRRRPSETLQLPQQRARGEHGHFAPRQVDAQPSRQQRPGLPPQGAQATGNMPAGNVIPLPPEARYREPPRGMNQ